MQNMILPYSVGGAWMIKVFLFNYKHIKVFFFNHDLLWLKKIAG